MNTQTTIYLCVKEVVRATMVLACLFVPALLVLMKDASPLYLFLYLGTIPACVVALGSLGSAGAVVYNDCKFEENGKSKEV